MIQGEGWVNSLQFKVDQSSTPTPVNRITHTNENTTFIRTSYVVGKTIPHLILLSPPRVAITE